ncbi:MAG: hypothetical protein DMG07_29280 [Acidobacteria bacterium]|nr:MAG: hypothetical protein DMG07_29280 [Acidobacteriota bacterium]
MRSCESSGCGAPEPIPAGGPLDDWPAYGHDPGGARHSPLEQIHRGNVRRLEVAWTYHTGDRNRPARSGRNYAFEATPILVDGTLFLSTPSNRVIALDPETGHERWVYDPGVDLSRHYSEFTSRGVSTWLDPRAPAGAACRRRIFVGTLDARLIALDAATGSCCADFGAGGQVDLFQGAGNASRGDNEVTSPPAIIGDLVVVGSAIGDNQRADDASGVVRAFDARTGALRWSWDPIPRRRDDPARTTWAGDSADSSGAANAWSVLSADPERGLVFVPTGSASPDFYGGERRGDNRYANSVVALRASSGEVVWHFQVVHHDVWDYDVPAQPALVTVRRDGREIPAVAQTTKMGLVFALDRETGEPLGLADAALPGSATAARPPPPVGRRGLGDHSLGPGAGAREDPAAPLRGDLHSAEPRGDDHLPRQHRRIELERDRVRSPARAAPGQHQLPGDGRDPDTARQVRGGEARQPRRRDLGAKRNAVRHAARDARVAVRPAVQSSAVGDAPGDRPRHGLDPLAGAARDDARRPAGADLGRKRDAEPRRTDDDGGRPGVHRGRDGQLPARLRRRNRT